MSEIFQLIAACAGAGALGAVARYARSRRRWLCPWILRDALYHGTIGLAVGLIAISWEPLQQKPGLVVAASLLLALGVVRLAEIVRTFLKI